MSLSGYQKHVSSCSAPAPLTAAEQELQQIRINEVGVLHMGSNSWDGVQQLGWCPTGLGVLQDGVQQLGWCPAELGVQQGDQQG